MLDEALSSLLKPIKQFAESGFENSLKSAETRTGLSMILSNFCHIREAIKNFAVWQSAGREHPGVWQQRT